MKIVICDVIRFRGRGMGETSTALATICHSDLTVPGCTLIEHYV